MSELELDPHGLGRSVRSTFTKIACASPDLGIIPVSIQKKKEELTNPYRQGIYSNKLTNWVTENVLMDSDHKNMSISISDLYHS